MIASLKMDLSYFDTQGANLNEKGKEKIELKNFYLKIISQF